MYHRKIFRLNYLFNAYIIVYHEGKMIIENESAEDDFKSDKLVRTTYKACKNEKQREKLGVQPLKKALRGIGGWPVLDDGSGKNKRHGTPNSNFSWTELILMLSNLGDVEASHGIMKYDIMKEKEKFLTRAIVLDSPNFTNRKKGFLGQAKENHLAKQYFEKMIEIAIHLGASEAKARQELESSLHLEIDLVSLETHSKEQEKKARPSVYSSDKLGVPKPVSNKNIVTTLGEVNALLNPDGSRKQSGIATNWKEFIQLWLKRYNIKPGLQEKVIIRNQKYLQDVSAALTKYQNSQITIANYLGWLMIEESLEWLDKKSQKLSSDLQNIVCQSETNQDKAECKIRPINKQNPQWKQCLNSLGFNNLDWTRHPQLQAPKTLVPAASLYVRRKIGPLKMKKDFGIQMTKNLRKQLLLLIEESKWMDDKTKLSALDVIKSMKHNIGFPRDITNKTFMDKNFGGNSKCFQINHSKLTL